MSENSLDESDIHTKLSIGAIVSFALTSAICSLIIFIIVATKIKNENLTMEQCILEKSTKLNEVISRLLSRTHIISAMMEIREDTSDDFEHMAAAVVDDPAIMNIFVAPSGVVSKVYPLHGNENLIGLNLFEEGAVAGEAVRAKEQDRLTFGGPFPLPQGGQALAGLLPVFLGRPGSGKDFRGLLGITLKYPQAMADVGLDELSLYGLGYELWRINPDGDAKQIITGVGDHVSPFGRFVEKRVSIVDADWNLRIGVAGKWYDAPEIRAMIPVALLISFLVAFLMQKRFDLKAMKKLKHMAYIDSLTEVFNRRCFMELASLRIEMLKRTKEFGFLIIFDLDNFKKINDTYGHLAGDEVLRVIPGRIKMCIRPYDLMARYGGDEFIMFITCADATDIADVVERCRRSIAGKPVEFEDKNIPVTASFGVAAFSPDLDLKTAMKFADEALYGAKKKGRNICDMHGNCELLPLYSGHG